MILSPPLDLTAAWERERIARARVTELWCEDEARARQYGHCIINVSPRTSQAYRDAIAAWVYATQSEREAVAI